MRHIEIKVLNPHSLEDAEKMMVAAAKLTQRGHTINNMQDFMNLYHKQYQKKTVETLLNLPHPTIQKLGIINIVITGASLQYSDYSHTNQFVIPYELIDKESEYLKACEASMDMYKRLVDGGVSNDTAGYVAPQSLRNVLIISATPYQWKHMISQRVCRRNTTETRYVMLKIWMSLQKINPDLFSKGCGAFCQKGKCMEGTMSCHNPMIGSPTDILKKEYDKIMR